MIWGMDQDRLIRVVGMTIGAGIFLLLVLMAAWSDTDWDFLWIANALSMIGAVGIVLVGVSVIWGIVRWINHRDDSHIAERPPDAP